MTSSRILVSKLACQRGERLLFQGVSFELSPGDALLITGPNGVGKTTLLRALAGFVPAEHGSVVVKHQNSDISMAEAAHFIGHRDGLRGALTVRENLVLAPELMGSHGLSVVDASARLRLDHLLDLPVSVLSAGQRRRTALARLLVAPRPIWLLDEPTSSLDTASVRLTAQIITGHVAGGGIVLAATHLPLGLAHPRELIFADGGTHRFAGPRP